MERQIFLMRDSKAGVLAGRAAERRGQGRPGICNRGGGVCEYREGG